METINKSMEELMDFTQGKDNEVGIEVYSLNKESKLSLFAKGKDKYLKELDKDLKEQKVNVRRGNGYADYDLVIKDYPRNFVYNLSSKYPKVEFIYQSVNIG